MSARMICLPFVLGLVLVMTNLAQKKETIPKEGYLPDEKTATKVGEAILSAIYGEESIASQRPFKATLLSDKWTVKGTLAKGHIGGTAEIILSKSDARVILVRHGR